MPNMMKDQEHASHKSRSRAKFSCPPELERLIFEFNLAPIEKYPLRSLEAEREVQEQYLRQVRGDPDARILKVDALKVCLASAPRHLVDYLTEKSKREPFGDPNRTSIPELEYSQLAHTYSEYYAMRVDMDRLLDSFESDRARQTNPVSPTSLLELVFPPICLQTRAIRTKNGDRRITGLAWVLGKFDEDRLRRCHACRNAFWAKRSDSKTCSPRCLNIYHVEAFRKRTQEEKAEIAKRRKRNRKHKRDLIKKKKKEKNDGTL
jgi:hypothetical protein